MFSPSDFIQFFPKKQPRGKSFTALLDLPDTSSLSFPSETPASDITYSVTPQVSLFDKTHLVSIVPVVCWCNMIPALLTFAAFPQTYINLLLTASFVFFMHYYFRNHSCYSFQFLFKVFSFSLGVFMFSNTIFLNLHDTTRMFSAFAFVIYPLIYSPKVTLKIAAFNILVSALTSCLANSYIPINETNEARLRFIQVSSYVVGHLIVSYHTIKQLAPLSAKNFLDFSIMMKRIDAILSHLFPPFIAYVLSHTPLVRKNFGQLLFPETVNNFQLFKRLRRRFWCAFSLQSKELIDPHLIESTNQFLELNPGIMGSNDSQTKQPSSASSSSSGLPEDFSSSTTMLVLDPPPRLSFFEKHFLRLLGRYFFPSYQYQSRPKCVQFYDTNITIFLRIDCVRRSILPEHIPFIRSVVDLWDMQIIEFNSSCTRVDKIKVFQACQMLISLPKCTNFSFALNLVGLLIHSFSEKRALDSGVSLDLSLNIAITAGPVIAGVWGRSLFQYDVVGHSVNLASLIVSSVSTDESHFLRPASSAQLLPPVDLSSSTMADSDNDEEGITLKNLDSSESTYDIHPVDPEIGCPNPTPSESVETNKSINNDSPPSQSTIESKYYRIRISICEVVYQKIAVIYPSTKKHIFSLKGMGKNIPIYSLTVSSLFPLKSTQLIPRTSQGEWHGILRIPNEQTYYAIFFMTFFFSFAMCLTAIFNLLLIGSFNVISVVGFCGSFILFILSLYLWFHFKMFYKILASGTKSSVVKQYLKTFTKIFSWSYFFVCILVFGIVSYLVLPYFDQTPSSPFFFFISTFLMVSFLDHTQFSSQVQFSLVLGTFFTIISMFTSTLISQQEDMSSGTLVDPQTSLYGVLTNRDLIALFFDFCVSLTITLPLFLVNSGRNCAVDLFNNSLHPSLKLLLMKIQNQTENPFEYPLQSLHSVVEGNVSCVFLYISGFNEFTQSAASPDIVAQLLDLIFSKYDRLVQEFGLVKTPTSANTYIILGNEPGIPIDPFEFRLRLCRLITFSELATQLFNQIVTSHPSFQGHNLCICGGLAVGSCYGALVGRIRPSFQYFGSSFNKAYIQSCSAPLDKILVDASVLEYVSLVFLAKYPSFLFQNFSS